MSTASLSLRNVFCHKTAVGEEGKWHHIYLANILQLKISAD